MKALRFRQVSAPRLALLRLLIVGNLLLATFYLSWRYLYSINWVAWPAALALIAAETYSYIDAWLFGLTIFRLKRRAEPPPPSGATVDVFITCYNEPPELVRHTVHAALRIAYPHTTYVLDDGKSAAMQAMAAEEGAKYIVRSADWQGRERHAKAGNLSNALLQTRGEFILILDADQVPLPQVLDRTLGYFRDERVALVQTPQLFYNVPPGDPLGSQAPLFYGPIQQGKDGWNAAFFCGSNAVLRREALMQLGVRQYVSELERRVTRALRTAARLLDDAERRLPQMQNAADRERIGLAIGDLRRAVRESREQLRQGAPVYQVTQSFQRCAQEVGRRLVSDDLAQLNAELATVPGVNPDTVAELGETLQDDAALAALTGRETSPLAALTTVRGLLLAVDVDRSDEAQPVMPLATISVTEDMATSLRLHAHGWLTVYHHEDLVHGLAPEDLGTALQQRLRWAQGTLQVMYRENPLTMRGLRLGQRLMYFSTMWTYLSGFASAIYIVMPLLFLFFGILPVRAYSSAFFLHLVPFLVVNQLVFFVVGLGLPTFRGQQYSLALFPLWIRAVISTTRSVLFGARLGFVVTPKAGPQGRRFRSQLALVWPQLVALVLLASAMLYGIVRLALGLASDRVPVLVNIFWCGYDLMMLSVIVGAVRYNPSGRESSPWAEEAAAEIAPHDRILAGGGS
jgi:cellulose synthase (UDP-forming)